MRQKLWCIGLLLLTIMAGGAAFADQDHRKSEDALDKMMREGWKPVAPGVLQRRTSERRVETYAIGADGLRWAVREMENRLRFLESQYQVRPKDDLRKTIEKYRQEIVELQKDIELAEAIGDDGMMADAFDKSGCSVSFAAHATATHLTNTQGVTATGTAHFNNTCGWYVETHAEANATATRNGVVDYFSQTDGPKGTWATTLSSSATATVQGGPNCSSSSYSYARYAAANIFLSASESNYSCPSTPPSGSISGPSSLSIWGYGYDAATWYASASGGVPPYSYKWYRDGNLVGTGSSYSEGFYGNNYTWTQTVNISLTVTDSIGQTASDTHTTYVYYYYHYEDPGCGSRYEFCP